MVDRDKTVKPIRSYVVETLETKSIRIEIGKSSTNLQDENSSRREHSVGYRKGGSNP